MVILEVDGNLVIVLVDMVFYDLMIVWWLKVNWLCDVLVNVDFIFCDVNLFVEMIVMLIVDVCV